MEVPRPVFDPDRMAVHRKVPAVPREVTVSQLNSLIKLVLADGLPGTIHLIGEISNFSRATSGHLYMTLKDAASEIRAVMWRSVASALKFKPADGLEVIATGYVEVYEPRGQYQFYIRKLEPRGTGALELAFRQLHDRLAKEGLFDPAHKKRLPPFPRRIAVVTSPTGAAIRDILRTLQRRFPCVTVLVHPVKVQGTGAAAEIAAAIWRLNDQAEALGGIDVMIVGRGGGSLEDLWAFNEEVVARAVYASRIPIISGVGHEADITICDLVADVRAPTPTGAAVVAAPFMDELRQTLAERSARLGRAARHRLVLARTRLDGLARLDWFRDPLGPIRRQEQRLDELTSRLQWVWSHRLTQLRRRLHRIEMLLSAIQPQAFLQRQRSRLIQAAHQLRWALEQRMRRAEHDWQGIHHALTAASPRRQIEARRQDVQVLTRDLERAGQRRLDSVRRNLEALEARLEATSYRRTLARGFTITRRIADRQVITNPRQVSAGEGIATETSEGEFTSRVDPAPDGT